jgi:polysaccharide biosynthesis/export protein
MKNLVTVLRQLLPVLHGIGNFILYRGIFCILLSMPFVLGGCSEKVNKYFDPAQVGRYRPVPAINMILDTLGVAEETPIAWEQGEEPKPADTVSVRSDYKFLSGDVVRVSIFELLAEGLTYVNDYVVTETGRISIPQAGIFEVTGSSEMQLENQIKKRLSPNILKNPLVNVTLLSSQQRTFSILGEGVMVPNRYVIPRHDFYLTDALATASGLRTGSQDKISYIYVSRPVRSSTSGSLSAVNLNTGIDSLTTNLWPESSVVISTSEMSTDNSRNSQHNTQRRGLLQELFANDTYTGTNAGDNTTNSLNRRTEQPSNDTPSVQDVIKTLSSRSGAENTNLRNSEPPNQNTLPSTNRRPAQPQQNIGQQDLDRNLPPKKNTDNGQEEGYIEWVYKDGRWVPVQVGTPKQTLPPANGVQKQPNIEIPSVPPEQTTVVEPVEQGANTRLIKIPADKLFAGDRRYNIVIKPGDTIFVPVDVTGVFYIMGHVNRTGTVAMTQPMTLKQAVAAAGGLGQLASPKRCEVVRRIGKNREEIVMVDLDKIFNGEQPDFFIKPNDMINVGTDITARFKAVLRNAFRATYGFGFVYDRNFADRDFYNSPLPGNWF